MEIPEVRCAKSGEPFRDRVSGVADGNALDEPAGSVLLFLFEDAGESGLKGVPDRWQLYRMVGG